MFLFWFTRAIVNAALLFALLSGPARLYCSVYHTVYGHINDDDDHWRRQLWGTGARAPPQLPARYFVREQIRNMYKNNAILRNFYEFLAHFVIFLPTVFLRE